MRGVKKQKFQRKRGSFNADITTWLYAVGFVCLQHTTEEDPGRQNTSARLLQLVNRANELHQRRMRKKAANTNQGRNPTIAKKPGESERIADGHY